MSSNEIKIFVNETEHTFSCPRGDLLEWDVTKLLPDKQAEYFLEDSESRNTIESSCGWFRGLLPGKLYVVKVSQMELPKPRRNVMLDNNPQSHTQMPSASAAMLNPDEAMRKRLSKRRYNGEPLNFSFGLSPTLKIDSRKSTDAWRPGSLTDREGPDAKSKNRRSLVESDEFTSRDVRPPPSLIPPPKPKTGLDIITSANHERFKQLNMNLASTNNQIPVDGQRPIVQQFASFPPRAQSISPASFPSPPQTAISNQIGAERSQPITSGPGASSSPTSNSAVSHEQSTRFKNTITVGSSESLHAEPATIRTVCSDYALDSEADIGFVKTVCMCYPDQRPLPGGCYFQMRIPQDQPKICAIVPFFNEEGIELQRTLQGLWEQSIPLMDDFDLPMQVLVVMDGWDKSSDSMKDYIEFMFPPNEGETPWINDLCNKQRAKNIETFVLERLLPNCCNAVGDVRVDPDDPEKVLPVTCIIKRDNRRKHNSHEWFFGECGFAEHVGATYLFATDAFTLYAPKCVYYLVDYMQRNEKCSAATGRQRVMTRGQQTTNESFLSIGSWYRCAQCFDYEASFACYNGAFALFGFLPVIPGPCGLYRAADILGEPVAWYFDVVNSSPDETGMVLGNLRIAEDRVLSYAAVLKTHEPRYMALVPEATFYFEAELDLRLLVLQRRRWINGTVAGYLYLIVYNPDILWRSPMGIFRKIAVYILLGCQLLVYAVVAVSPSIFITNFSYSLQLMFDVNPAAAGLSLPGIIWYTSVLLYIMHSVHHTYTAYEGWIFVLLLIIGVFIVGGAFWSIVLYGENNGIQNAINQLDSLPNLKTENLPLVAFLIMILPLILALIHSPESFVYMVVTVVPFYLFVPMLVAWFGAYSFGRCWDLSWGNRPSNSMDAVAETKKKDEVLNSFKQRAKTICAVLVGLNMFVLMVLQFKLNNVVVLIVVLSFLFGFAVLQMFLSFLYFALFYLPRRIYSMGRFCCSLCGDRPNRGQLRSSTVLNYRRSEDEVKPLFENKTEGYSTV